tara:strand:- start:2483 stop:3109 length:627 start_codon:yes stop_codon:yes gene_type:complete
MLKNIKHIFLILIISFFSCDLDIEYVEVDDPEKIELDSINQVSKDAVLINKYIDSVDLKNIFTLDNGVKYSITKKGNDIFPENNNILSININGYYMNDTTFSIFDTNSKTVAESNDIFINTNEYVPIAFTYTTDGRYFGLNSLHGYLTLINHLKKSIGEIMPSVDENGKFTIILPSGTAYGKDGNSNFPVIPGNSILIFEIHLLKIRK